jgi:DNA polymerase III alpha subunit
MNQPVSRALGALILVFLAVAAVLAQGPRKGTRNYDPSTEMTVTGTVEEVQQQQGKHGWNGTHVVLKTDAENIEVHVGPSSYLTEKQFSFAKGDQIEVVGSKVKLGTNDVLIAREITKDSNKLVLRNAQGIPLWSRGRRSN